MPKQAKIKKNKRSEVRQQDTFEYAQNIQPAARPVDYNTRVTPQNTQGGAAEALLQGLGLLEKGTKATFDVIDKSKKNYKEAGKIAAGKGEAKEAPGSIIPGTEDAWIEGYEEMTGAGEGYLELEKVLQAHANANAGATMDEFALTQDQVIREFFMGRTEAYSRGALPGAIQLQREHQKDFMERQQAEFELDKLTKSRALNDANITQIIKSEPESLSQTVRMELNHAQERGKVLGLSKLQVSNQFVNLMGQRAVDSADADIMKFAFEKGPDGIRLIDNPKLAKSIKKYVDDADAEAVSRETARVKQQEKLRKDVTADIGTDLAEYSAMMRNPEIREEDRRLARDAFRKLLRKYSDRDSNPHGIELTERQISGYEKDLQIITGAGDSLFGAASNPEVEANAREVARTNPLALTNEYMDQIKPFLSKDDYVAIVELRAQSMESRRKESHKKSQGEIRWEKSKSLALDVISKKNALGVALFEKGPERERIGNALLNNLVDQFRQDNKGRWPNELEAYELGTQALKMVNDHPEFGIDPDTGLPRGGRVDQADADNSSNNSGKGFNGDQATPKGRKERFKKVKTKTEEQRKERKDFTDELEDAD
jgi:hypothetical protein